MKSSKNQLKKKSPKKSLRLSDSTYQVGDFYADSEIQGRVSEVDNGYLKVEYMDENGDVQIKEVDLSEVKDSATKNDLYYKCEELISLIGAERLFWDLFEYLPSSTIENFLNDTQEFDEIEDSIESRRAAEFALDANKVIDLYIDGETEVTIPSGIPTEEFKDDCLDLIFDLWDEPDVNFEYDKKDIDYAIEGNVLKFFVK